MGSPLSLRDPGLSSASNIKTVASVNADQRRVKVTTHLTVQANLTPRPLVENMNYAQNLEAAAAGHLHNIAESQSSQDPPSPLALPRADSQTWQVSLQMSPEVRGLTQLPSNHSEF